GGSALSSWQPAICTTLTTCWPGLCCCRRWAWSLRGWSGSPNGCCCVGGDRGCSRRILLLGTQESHATAFRRPFDFNLPKTDVARSWKPRGGYITHCIEASIQLATYTRGLRH